MNSLKTSTLLSVLLTLSACGNLEWPPESGGAGYGASQPGFVKEEGAHPKRNYGRLPGAKSPAIGAGSLGTVPWSGGRP